MILTTKFPSNRRVLPPFGAQLAADDPLPIVYVGGGGKAWRLAEPKGDRPASMVLPKGADPAAYTWPTHSRDVLIMDLGADRDQVLQLAVELLRQGARVVHVKFHGKTDPVTYQQSVAP
jgi:hypothetical protein